MSRGDNSTSKTVTDNFNRLKVTNGNNNLFGESKVVQYNPQIQIYAPYGIINNQWYEQFTATGGTISSASDGTQIKLDITTDIGSYAVIRSKKVLKYRPGFSNTVKFNVIYDTPVANSLQFGGVGNAGSDLYFAYNGTDFGVRRSTNGLAEVRKLTINTAATGPETATITVNGTVFTATLSNAGGDISFTAHEIEIGDTYTEWNIEHINGYIIFQNKNVGAKNGSYSFSSTGTALGTWEQEKEGSLLETQFVSKNNWNGKTVMVDRIDPLKRNMYEIEYSWYGSGDINYKILNPDTSEYEIVHTMKFANIQTEPNLTQPNMYIQQGLASLGSTTAMTVNCAGLFGATLGQIQGITPMYSISSTKTLAASTEKVLVVLKSRNTVNGFSNQSQEFIKNLSVATDGNRTVEIKIIRNPSTLSADTTTDYTSLQYIDENNSLGVFDTVCETYTGGDIISKFFIGKDGNLFINKNIEFYQKDTIIITGYSTAVNTVDLSLGIFDDL